MKTAYDKLENDISIVTIIESKLKAKPWDTTTTVKYINESAKPVKQNIADVKTEWQKGEVFISDSTAKSDIEIQAMDTHAKTIVEKAMESLKHLIKHVLSEFINKKE